MQEEIVCQQKGSRENMNALRQKLEQKKRLYGTNVNLTDPCLCELVGNIGYDVVWVDMEHTYLSYADVMSHLNAARSTGIPALVRVPQHDLTATKKVLEMGPEAILFPMVRSAEEARELIDMTLYPPLGSRGFGPVRAIRYGADDAAEYTRKQSLDLCRFIQIESVRLIDQLDEVAAIPYVDGFIFGPNDLSGSAGDFMNVFEEKTVTQIKRAIEIARKHGKIVGLSGGADEQTVRFWSQFDLDILFAGGDWIFLYSAGKQTLDHIKQYFPR